MPPNPEFHNTKQLPEGNSFANMAFTSEDDTDAQDRTNNASAQSAVNVAGEPLPGSTTIVNRRNSSGNSNGGKSKQQDGENKNGHSSSENDSNNNNGGGGGDKGTIPACGSSDVDSSQLMDFDDLLPHIGEFGRYQKILFLLMIPFAFFVAWTYFSQIFLTLVPQEFHCALPELESLISNKGDRYVVHTRLIPFLTTV